MELIEALYLFKLLLNKKELTYEEFEQFNYVIVKIFGLCDLNSYLQKIAWEKTYEKD